MDMQELRYFVTAADLGNYSAAASVLFVSRQAITKGIRKLESEIGRPLFEVEGKHLIPTAEGSALLEDARPLVDAFTELCRTHLNSTPLPGNSFRESLHVAVSAGWHIGLAGDPIAEFQLSYPSAVTYVTEGDSAAVVRAVASKRADVGLLHTHPTFIASYDFIRLQSIALHFIVPNEHPLAAKQTISTADLDGCNIFTVSSTNHFREYIFSRCRQDGYRPVSCGEAGTVEALSRVSLTADMLRFGGHPSIMPLPTGTKAIPMDIAGTEEFGTYAIRRHTKHAPSVTRFFWDLLQSTANDQVNRNESPS